MSNANATSYCFSDDSIQILSNIGHRKIVPKGEVVLRQWQENMPFVFLLDGELQINSTSEEGRDIYIRIIAKHDCIGGFNVFLQDDYYSRVTAVALINSEVQIIPIRDLEQAIESNVNLMREFIRCLGHRAEYYESKYRHQLFSGKYSAIYSKIIRFSKIHGLPVENGVLIDYQFTNQTLANFCGITRENTNRMIRNLHNKGIISFTKGKIIIHDMEYLYSQIGDLADLEEYKRDF